MSIVQPIGTLNRKITRADIVELANQHAETIIDSGQYDLLKTYVEMKRYEIYLKTIIGRLKTISTQQAQGMREDEENYPPGNRPSEGREVRKAALFAGESPADEQPVIRHNTIHYASASVQLVRKVTYSFSEDAEWQRLTDGIALLKVQLKKREEQLKKGGQISTQNTENIMIRL